MRFFAPLALVWALAAPASAQDVAVLIVEDETTGAEREAIASALREELGLEVRTATTPEADELALTVGVRGRRARLEVTRPGRARTVRRVTLPRDPDARLYTLVMLAINLTRDEAAELLSSMRRPPLDGADGPPTPVTDAITGAAQAGSGEPAEVTVDPVEEAPVEEAPVEAPAVEEAPVEEQAVPQEATAEEASSEEAAAQDPWRHRMIRLGAGAHLGTAPEAGGGVRPWTIFGIDLVVAPIPELAIGVRDFGVITDGREPVIIAGPVVEGMLRVHERVALHAIVGADLQLSFTQAVSFSVAPRLGLGARAYLDPIFSIALDITGRVVATDVFRTTAATLPSRAVLLSIGLSFAFHIG
jgi:hypothetical protein